MKIDDQARTPYGYNGREGFIITQRKKQPVTLTEEETQDYPRVYGGTLYGEPHPPTE